MTARFLDVLAGYAAREVLVLGPGRSCPLAGLLGTLPEAHFTLVDYDSRVKPYIDALGFGAVRVITHDACERSAYDDRRYGLIVCRHPDIDKHPRGWAAAFAAAAGTVEAGAPLLVSTYTLAEARGVQRALEATPFKIRRELKSAVPVALSGADRYILRYFDA